jgi:hypothetical protein
LSKWHKYYELESIQRLKNEGRELLGQRILLTEKRDGENVSIWLDATGTVHISSHNQEVADESIVSRFKNTPEYPRAVELLRDEMQYNNDLILYGELLKTVSPTRLEPKRKHVHWILFDIYDCKEERYIGYTLIYQKAYNFKIPIVNVTDSIICNTMEVLEKDLKEALHWCKKHRREGIVGKDYANQIMFKEKLNTPKLPKIKGEQSGVQYPSMPDDRILRALQHAFDEVKEENWSDKSKAMPAIAKHLAVEGREHNFAVPRNMYQIYLDAKIENIKGVREDVGTIERKVDEKSM